MYRVLQYGDRWLVVRTIAGLPVNAWLGVVADCMTQAAAERVADQMNTPCRPG